MDSHDLELYSLVGKMLRDIRLDHGYTLEYVAEHLPITTKTLQRYERGERKIKMNIISLLCDFYKIDFDTFILDAKSRFTGDLSPLNNTFSIDNYKPDNSGEFNFHLSRLEQVIIDKYRLADDITKQMIYKILDIPTDNIHETAEKIS